MRAIIQSACSTDKFQNFPVLKSIVYLKLPVTENSESTGETIESNIIYQQQRLTRIMGTVT